MPSVFQNNDQLLQLTPEWFELLKEAAREAPKGRARLNLHSSADDTVQEMIIAFQRDSVLPPHRTVGKSESLEILEGEAELVIFGEEGSVLQRVPLGTVGSGKPFLYRLEPIPWHTVVPRSEYVIVHEVMRGPFISSDTIYPDWAPGEGEATRDYVDASS